MKAGDVIGVLFDADAGVMSFAVNGNPLGEAFSEKMHGNLVDCRQVWAQLGQRLPPGDNSGDLSGCHGQFGTRTL